MTYKEATEVLNSALDKQADNLRAVAAKECELSQAIAALKKNYREILEEVLQAVMAAIPGAVICQISANFESEYDDQGSYLDYLSYSMEMRDSAENILTNEDGDALDLEFNDYLQELLNDCFSVSDVKNGVEGADEIVVIKR